MRTWLYIVCNKILSQNIKMATLERRYCHKRWNEARFFYFHADAAGACAVGGVLLFISLFVVLCLLLLSGFVHSGTASVRRPHMCTPK